MDQESIARCIELGAVDYMTKPCDPLLLRARVQNVFCATARMKGGGAAGTMLVVDDDALCRALLTTCLEEKGHMVAEVEERGTMAIKGKGDMTTWLLLGRK